MQGVVLGFSWMLGRAMLKLTRSYDLFPPIGPITENTSQCFEVRLPRFKGSSSRLPVGRVCFRGQILHQDER